MMNVKINKVCCHCDMRFYFGSIGNNVVSEDKQFEAIDEALAAHIEEKHTQK